MGRSGGLDVQQIRNEPVEMRDGTLLWADVYRPSGGGRHPVLVSRTPYDKADPGNEATARGLAERGYVVVAQDIRGRYKSDGEFKWQFQDNSETFDTEDGYDTAEWAAALPGSDGQVGTWGHSYPAWCSWRMASARPPSLKAVFAGGISKRLLDLTNGIFETGRRLQWTHNMAMDARRRVGDPGGPADRAQADLAWQEVERGKWVWYLPLGEIPDYVFSTLAPLLKKYMTEQNLEHWSFDDIHSAINVPTCNLTGWYDRINGTVDQYAGMVSHGPESLRKEHRLIVGPWGHSNMEMTGRQGPLDFGRQVDTTYVHEVTRWYDHHLKGVANGLAEEPPVKLFVMGANRWRYEHEWPLARTRYTDFFLHSGGGANTVAGDGVLSTAEPAGEPPDQFTYDPRDPVMSLMGLDSQTAPRDQSPLDARADVLVYQTPPLEQAVEITGPVEVRLWAASTAPDTDFTAKLVDVHPNGLAVNLTYGIMRASYRDGFEEPALMEPGMPYEFVIRLRPTSVELGPGHRLRLDISSSDFPNFDRNHNTGKDFWLDAELKIARQTVFHDAEHPSRLVLPVVED
jgi:putative CocE/NonD family hydrolase